MDAEADVLRAAARRADALASGDGAALAALLHEQFAWTSHTGERFDREAYVTASSDGGLRWHGQAIRDAQVNVVDDVAVLRCTMLDTVDRGAGAETFEMPVTQVWVRSSARWLLLAGHAGPLDRRVGE